MAITLAYRFELRASHDANETQRLASEPSTLYSGTTGLLEGGGRIVRLAGGETLALSLGDVTNVRALMIVPERDCILRQVVGDTGERIAAGKIYFCEFSVTSPPTAIRLTNGDAANTNDVRIVLVGT